MGCRGVISSTGAKRLAVTFCTITVQISPKIVYNMAAPATSQQASELLDDESLAEEVEQMLCFMLIIFLLSRSIFLC